MKKLMRIKLYSIFLVLIIAGCAHSNSKEELNSYRMQEQQKHMKECKKGKNLIAKGQKMVKKGMHEIKEGNEKVDKGNKLMHQCESSFWKNAMDQIIQDAAQG